MRELVTSYYAHMLAIVRVGSLAHVAECLVGISTSYM
jgi:hypothetical protein